MCECEYENAPYPSCQRNLPFTNLFSLIKLDELFLMSNQIGNSHSRPQPDKSMNMVRHTINDDWLLFLALDDAGNVFMQFIFPLLTNEIFPSFYREDNLNVNLRKCACHRLPPFDPEGMQLL